MENSVVIALGSNLGNKFENLQTALNSIKNFAQITDISSLYASKALLPENAPNSWDLEFLNCVIFCKTNLDVELLFEKLEEIEKKISPDRIKGSWSPRKIDIDIIDFNNEIYISENLEIPHKEMYSRDFVLVPLQEILPNWKCPKTKKSVNDFVKNLNEINLIKTNLKLS
jgi:2-amino-4-hydroxy-6-hydroxymethyldihydropteridine diphosphokinase